MVPPFFPTFTHQLPPSEIMKKRFKKTEILQIHRFVSLHLNHQKLPKVSTNKKHVAQQKKRSSIQHRFDARTDQGFDHNDRHNRQELYHHFLTLRSLRSQRNLRLHRIVGTFFILFHRISGGRDVPWKKKLFMFRGWSNDVVEFWNQTCLHCVFVFGACKMTIKTNRKGRMIAD